MDPFRFLNILSWEALDAQNICILSLETNYKFKHF